MMDRLTSLLGNRLLCRGALVLAVAGVLGLLPACGSGRPGPRPRPAAVNMRDVPAPLRGTLTSEAQLRGTKFTFVSGIGFVVGLNGTGGLPLPDDVAAHLEREMGLMGVGRVGAMDGTPFEGMSPSRLLQDSNTAAVIVQAAVPPGAREGTSFDVFVRAINATNLEGGVLWTTELRPGAATTFEGPRTRIIAEARGPIFINPFAEPGAEMDGVTRTVGRVLDGGLVVEPLLIQVVLDNPSHARARRVASSINSSFPEGIGDRGQIARGRNEQLIEVTVPYRYRNDAAEFVTLLQHLTIDRSFPEVYARRYAQTLRDQPYLANEMSWCLQSLGELSKSFLYDLYDFPETQPRLAALRAGASLDDPRTMDPLITLAMEGPTDARPSAVELLGRLEAGPQIEQTLRELLADRELGTRVSAYEALTKRAVHAQKRRFLEDELSSPGAGRPLTLARLETISRLRLRAGSIYGVSRKLVDGKFFLDRVPFGEPLIYVTQQHEPRIVLFGEELRLNRPLEVFAWSDRLMLISDGPEDPIRLFYRDDRTGQQVTREVSDSLVELIEFMAQRPTPEDPRPGLGLTYSEVVGALYELYRDRGIDAGFSTERDLLLARLVRAQTTNVREIELRPETPEDIPQVLEFDDPTAPAMRRNPATERRPESLLIPLKPPTPDAEGPDASGRTDGPGERDETGRGGGRPEGP